MPQLPNQWNASTVAGSQWPQSFTMLDDTTGRPLDLTGLTWELVIRPSVVDTASPALVQVSTTPGAQGYITVDLVNAVVQVVLSASATALLSQGARPFTLWSNPGTSTATSWVEGVFNTRLVAAV